jgi:hypothetical protein
VPTFKILGRYEWGPERAPVLLGYGFKSVATAQASAHKWLTCWMPFSSVSIVRADTGEEVSRKKQDRPWLSWPTT